MKPMAGSGLILESSKSITLLIAPHSGAEERAFATEVSNAGLIKPELAGITPENVYVVQ